MTGLAEFVAARLDEDEESACEAVQRPWRCEDNHIVDLDGGDVARFNVKADAAHAAMYEPARVLREVAAKRKILAAYKALAIDFTHVTENAYEFARREALEMACEALAAVWPDHPDYDRGWAP